MSDLMNALQELHERMQDSSNWNLAGICGNLEIMHLRGDRYVSATCRRRKLMQAWPEYSGDESYPVPAPEGTPGNAYNDSSPEDMWDRNKPYAAKRWELMEWMMRQEAGL